MMHPRESKIESAAKELQRIYSLSNRKDWRNVTRLTQYYEKRDQLRIPALLPRKAA